MNQAVSKVVIVGGGTAGWITAALFTKLLGRKIQLTLVESEQIGIVGVGEATIPPIIHLNNALGIDEKEFLRATKGSIKLGIQFDGWAEGASYMHAFGGVGKNYPFCDFHHFWVRARQLGLDTDFWDYSLNYQASINGKFAHLRQLPGTDMQGIAYAYHFDANLYAKFLAERCISHGVQRIEGKISQVVQHPQTGYIESVITESGQRVDADLFIDCSGMHGLLHDKTLNVGFEDWSHWLPCDRAVAVPCEGRYPAEPFTRSIAREAGWQWRIPLQHRIGNGHVYSSKYMDDARAQDILLQNLDGKALSEPRLIKFRTGRRLKQWHKNVVAIGLSSGFLEPLESTSIHLIQTAATRLAKLFPHQGIDMQLVETFNRQSQLEFEQIRDFVILHYKLNTRNDSKFWRDCRDMEIPATLEEKINLFRHTGRVFRENDELFSEIAWQQVMIGQGCVPQDYHPIAANLDKTQLQDMMKSLQTIIGQTVEKLPPYQQFLDNL